MRTIDPLLIQQNILHKQLLAAIAPRPIAFASTIDISGKANLSPFSFFNVFGVNPSTIIFSPARSGRTNTCKDTLLNIQEVPEVVINIVTYQMVEQVNLASAGFARGVNEFYKAGFTPVASEKIRPFRVKESPVQIECTVREVIETGKGPGSGNLVICEAVMMHVSDHVFDKTGMIDSGKLDLVGRLGQNYYVRASGKALFELDKPSESPVVGVDALPESVRLSTVLTGNDLGKLGNTLKMPTAHEVSKLYESSAFQSVVIQNSENSEVFLNTIHHHARKLIRENHISDALLYLLAADFSIKQIS
jgi:flavin reductase (DIM6/NTAB) family NADH-FMN oxidoreductase RutF